MTILSKILGIYKVVTPIIENKIIVTSNGSQREEPDPQDNIVQATKQADQENKKPEMKLDNIKLTDVDDIFGDVPEKKQISGEKAQFENFNSVDYIDALKSIGTKGALIISLKQARNFSMHENHLEIVLQNNFTLKVMNTGENVLQLIKGLEKMGIEGKTVKLN